jgi:hypothetical protein
MAPKQIQQYEQYEIVEIGVSALAILRYGAIEFSNTCFAPAKYFSNFSAGYSCPFRCCGRYGEHSAFTMGCACCC